MTTESVCELSLPEAHNGCKVRWQNLWFVEAESIGTTRARMSVTLSKSGDLERRPIVAAVELNPTQSSSIT
ncbi:hypothetical protein ACHAXS_011794 [Conticribra weissflogii]